MSDMPGWQLVNTRQIRRGKNKSLKRELFPKNGNRRTKEKKQKTFFNEERTQTGSGGILSKL